MWFNGGKRMRVRSISTKEIINIKQHREAALRGGMPLKEKFKKDIAEAFNKFKRQKNNDGVSFSQFLQMKKSNIYMKSIINYLEAYPANISENEMRAFLHEIQGETNSDEENQAVEEIMSHIHDTRRKSCESWFKEKRNHAEKSNHAVIKKEIEAYFQRSADAGLLDSASSAISSDLDDFLLTLFYETTDRTVKSVITRIRDRLKHEKILSSNCAPATEFLQLLMHEALEGQKTKITRLNNLDKALKKYRNEQFRKREYLSEEGFEEWLAYKNERELLETLTANIDHVRGKISSYNGKLDAIGAQNIVNIEQFDFTEDLRHMIENYIYSASPNETQFTYSKFCEWFLFSYSTEEQAVYPEIQEKEGIIREYLLLVTKACSKPRMSPIQPHYVKKQRQDMPPQDMSSAESRHNEIVRSMADLNEFRVGDFPFDEPVDIEMEEQQGDPLQCHAEPSLGDPNEDVILAMLGNTNENGFVELMQSELNRYFKEVLESYRNKRKDGQFEGNGTYLDTDSFSGYLQGQVGQILLKQFEKPVPQGYQAENITKVSDLIRDYLATLNEIYLNNELYQATERFFADSDIKTMVSFMVWLNMNGSESQKEAFNNVDSEKFKKYFEIRSAVDEDLQLNKALEDSRQLKGYDDGSEFGAAVEVSSDLLTGLSEEVRNLVFSYYDSLRNGGQMASLENFQLFYLLSEDYPNKQIFEDAQGSEMLNKVTQLIGAFPNTEGFESYCDTVARVKSKSQGANINTRNGLVDSNFVTIPEDFAQVIEHIKTELTTCLEAIKDTSPIKETNPRLPIKKRPSPTVAYFQYNNNLTSDELNTLEKRSTFVKVSDQYIRQNGSGDDIVTAAAKNIASSIKDKLDKRSDTTENDLKNAVKEALEDYIGIEEDSYIVKSSIVMFKSGCIQAFKASVNSR